MFLSEGTGEMIISQAIYQPARIFARGFVKGSIRAPRAVKIVSAFLNEGVLFSH